MKKLLQKNRTPKINSEKFKFKAKSKKEIITKNNNATSVLVKNISISTTDEQFSSYFSKFGKLIATKIQREHQSNESKGFGYVQYSDVTMVENLFLKQPHILDCKKLVVRRLDKQHISVKSEQTYPTRTLFISSIDFNKLTKPSLQLFFQNFGNVVKIQIPHDKKSSQPKNFGFIEFDDINAVEKITQNDSVLINNIKVYVKKSISSNNPYKLSELSNDMVTSNRNSSMNKIYGCYKLAPDSPYNFSFLMNKLLTKNSMVRDFPKKFTTSAKIS